MDLRRLADWFPLRGRWLVYALTLVLTCSGVCLLLKASLNSMEPFGMPLSDRALGFQQSFQAARDKVFLDFAGFFMAVALVSVLFGLLTTYGTNGLVSRWGGWGIAGLGGAFVACTALCPLLPYVLLPFPAVCLSIVAVVRVVRTRRYALDLLIIPFSFIIIPFYLAFVYATWSLYGD